MNVGDRKCKLMWISLQIGIFSFFYISGSCITPTFMTLGPLENHWHDQHLCMWDVNRLLEWVKNESKWVICIEWMSEWRKTLDGCRFNVPALNWAAPGSKVSDLVFLSWECFSVAWYYNDRSEQRGWKGQSQYKLNLEYCLHSTPN